MVADYIHIKCALNFKSHSVNHVIAYIPDHYVYVFFHCQETCLIKDMVAASAPSHKGIKLASSMNIHLFLYLYF